MSDNSAIILYQSAENEPEIQVILQDETVWLTQAEMVTLFQRDKRTISYHIRTIFKEGELDENSVVQYFRTTAADGKSYNVAYYNLDVIISVGYRVRSHRGTQFRIWATKRLREYLIKGFVMDDDRLANRQTNYFDELVERVRRIRASERNFYEKVRDIFATSIDYDTKTDYARTFYATVQNKFHFAIHGHTAAELISKRVDSKKPHMGLTSWRGEIVTVGDAKVAKNYLQELELKRLELLVEQFLALAELRSIEKRPMYMADWVTKLDDFLVLNEKEVLQHSGKVSRKDMEAKVRQELAKYRENQQRQKLPSGQ
ncbi:MAG: virulence RhuM family protein [Anaerolineales bacterium]|nr:virulence RhuM family protein [Anaerolineales bacterium]